MRTVKTNRRAERIRQGTFGRTAAKDNVLNAECFSNHVVIQLAFRMHTQSNTSQDKYHAQPRVYTALVFALVLQFSLSTRKRGSTGLTSRNDLPLRIPLPQHREQKRQ